MGQTFAFKGLWAPLLQFRESGRELALPPTPTNADSSLATCSVGSLAAPLNPTTAYQDTAVLQNRDIQESFLLRRLYQMTEAKPFVRALVDGLDALLKESHGHLGYRAGSSRQLHLPLQILIGRPHLPDLEPIAVIQAGLGGNLHYRSCAAQISTPSCRPHDTRNVLSNLRQQACQLHLL